jgi:hypothetical protein
MLRALIEILSFLKEDFFVQVEEKKICQQTLNVYDPLSLSLSLFFVINDS